VSAPRSQLDAYLDELDRALEIEGAGAQGLVHMTSSLPELAPSAGARDRLFAALNAPGRLWQFAEKVAQLLDIGIERARALLDSLDDPSVWTEQIPGIQFLWVDGGPRVAAAVRGFVRVRAGYAFPDHEHYGDEHVLVLQGQFVDESRGLTFGPGEVDHMPPGTNHAFRVDPNGMDLMKLSIVHKGLRALGQDFLPR
jgi:hypothetical protein